jgi:EAL domain-containing protein (putative c-di-GMP-specific phosphodiesterase class I)
MNHSFIISSTLPRINLKAGQCLFSEGEKGDYAYIIDQGEIEIITIKNNQQIVLNVLESGSMFGELALLDGSPRSASAYAKTDVLLTIVTPEQVRGRIQEANPILRLLLMLVMRYFRSETKRSRPLQIEEKFPPDFPDSFPFQQKKFEAIELIRLESDLRSAIKKKELGLSYQPIIDLKTGDILGFEILLRWHCAKRGNVSPLLFIPLAESTSLILAIGEWVIKEGIKAILEIKAQTNQDLFISLNIAQRQIESTSFLTFLTQEVNKAQINSQQIKLEILERTLFSGEKSLIWVKYCRSLGYSLIIDDFGTGYANLAYLKKFNFDTVKIDKSFIDDIETSEKDRIICNALINLSQRLNMTVVAEGVETSSQAENLRKLGCNFAQGYFFSKPVSLAEAISLIKSSIIKTKCAMIKK